MAYDLATAQANLDAALAALATARTAQSHAVQSTTGGRQLTVAQHQSLLDEVKFWRSEVKRLQRGSQGITVRQGVPS